jgi:hypothetical protein
MNPFRVSSDTAHPPVPDLSHYKKGLFFCQAKKSVNISRDASHRDHSELTFTVKTSLG